jgi:hypothetical protein
VIAWPAADKSLPAPAVVWQAAKSSAVRLMAEIKLIARIVTSFDT